MSTRNNENIVTPLSLPPLVIMSNDDADRNFHDPQDGNAAPAGVVRHEEDENSVGILLDDDGNLRERRIMGGCCQLCGKTLYEKKRVGVLRKKVWKPLTVPGSVVRGQCLQCPGRNNATTTTTTTATIATSNEDADLATAIAISAMEAQNGGNDAAVAAALAAAVPITGTSTQMEATYTGPFNNYGERHGQGELHWSNGDHYKGTFFNGVRDGEGSLFFHDGSEYVGYWRGNQMHGQGTRRFLDGSVYSGQYREGRRSGPGRCYFSNGDLYVGEWRSDEMTGFGRYYYNNGQSFEGFFWEGKRNGRGKYQLADGRIDMYQYVEDQRVGEGVRWSKDRKKAWRLLDGKAKGRVTLQQASDIAERCERGGAN